MSARPAVYLRKGVRVRFGYSHEVWVVMARRRNSVVVRRLFDGKATTAKGLRVEVKALTAIQEHPAR